MPAPQPHREIAIVCTDVNCGKALFSQIQSPTRNHFGLYPGYLGRFAGSDIAVIITDAREDSAHVGLQQLAYLFRPKIAAEFGLATSLVDGLHAGDTVLVQENRRGYCPVAVSEGMSTSDTEIFPTEDLRQKILNSPAYVCDPSRLEQYRESANSSLPNGSLQSFVTWVRLGTFDKQLTGHGTREFARSKLGFDAADVAAYGVLNSAKDLDIPALSVKVLENDVTSEGVAEFARFRDRFLSAGVEIFEKVLRTAASA